MKSWLRLLAPRRRRPFVPGREVLILWWGSFPDGGATLGDYHAVANLVAWLAERGTASRVGTDEMFAFDGLPTVNPVLADPDRFSVVAFVCGPLVLNRRHRELLGRFRGLRKAALGVSIVGRRRLLPLVYDRVIPRDDDNETNMDLALANADGLLAAPLSASQRPALCLRGFQSEYGKERCLADAAEAVLNTVFKRHFHSERAIISTAIELPARTEQTIREDFQRTSLLLTTRLHGALFALAFRIPFIAVDQIRGGAKVAQVLGDLNWPDVYRADRLDENDVDAALQRLIRSGWTDDMERVRRNAVDRSRAMLDRCGDAVLELLADA